MNAYLSLLLGVACAGLGGELFVRGTVGIARWARISAGIVAATVAAFATSSPELSVAVTASLKGAPQISFGNALGSNIVNVALILGIALLFGSIRGSRADATRVFPVALLGPILTGMLSLDGELSRYDGAVLMGVFLVWMIIVILEMRKQRSAAEEVLGEQSGGLAFLFGLIGLALLSVAGTFFVRGAEGIAQVLGLSEFIIGAVIVAIGTTIPELATTLISRLRGHDEVGLGTILGSNIFNGLFIVAVAALIHPITVVPRTVVTALLFGLGAVILIIPSRQGIIQRWRGPVLLALYTAYVALTMTR